MKKSFLECRGNHASAGRSKLGLPGLLLAALFCVFGTLHAQAQIQVKGVVKDAAGKPVVGATVVVDGTTTGTSTNANGSFSISVPAKESVLKVSFIGFATQDVAVGGRTQLNVTLEEEYSRLDEVVVVGYGTMKRRDISGSVASISGKELLKGNPSSVNQALQGKSAGVQVNQSDGAPGAGVSLTIRGANSIKTSTEPLYVVDGIPFDAGTTPTSGANENNNQSTNPLSLINPNDIESIEVLKDASATAIYGSRGANGVVLITTKKGSDGQTHVEFNSNVTFSTLGKEIRMLNGYEFAMFNNEATLFSSTYDGKAFGGLPYSGTWKYPQGTGGKGDYSPKPEDYLSPGYYEDAYGNKEWVEDTDWQKEIYQQGISQEYNLSVSGGTEKGYFSFSGNYTDQVGIIKNSGYSRYSMRANVGRQVYDWLELGMNINYSHSSTDFQKTNSHDYSIIRAAMLYPPTIYADDNSIDDQLSLMWLSANPRTYVKEAKDNILSNTTFSSAFASVRILDNLRFRQNIGISYYSHDRGTYYSRLTGEGKLALGRGGQSNRNGLNKTFESILTFEDKFNDKHYLNVVGGFTVESAEWRWKSMTASDFPTDLTREYDMGAALTHDTPDTGYEEQMLISLLARANYVFNDRYIATVSMRRDGSSHFVKGNKFANFFSGAVAWRLSEEQFIKDLRVFSNLKLRASAGQTGNQGIAAYATMEELRVSNYPFGGVLNSGFDLNTGKGAINPNLKWETTDQYNVGLDMGLWDGRLNFTFDIYKKKTRDLLQAIKTPSSSGYDIKMVNFGNVTNEGIEIAADFNVFKKGNLRWNINANISFNRNRMGGLPSDQYAQRLWSAYDDVFVQRNGLPIGAIMGWVEDGYYDNVAEVLSDPANADLLKTAKPEAAAQRFVGEIKYRDMDGVPGINEGDRTIIGDTNPDFIYGITNNFTWKNINFSFFLQGVQGNDIFNANNTNITMNPAANITADAYYKRWTPENKAGAEWPRATTAETRVMRLSNRYIEDGSYLKLKNVTLGYTLYPKFKGITSINVYASASNLLTITGYSWFDPDVNAFGGDVTRRGVDLYSYPSSRNFSLGVKIVF